MPYRIAKTCSLILIGFIIAFISILVCDYYDSMGTVFWQVRLIDLLRLVTNVLIAIFIVYYLKNKYSDRQRHKTLFLEVISDIANIFNEKSDVLLDFMRKADRTNNKKIKLLLFLKQIDNKINVLETHDHQFGEQIETLVKRVRNHFNIIDNLVAGSKDFVETRSFSEDSINKVLKNTFDITFLLDQIKLNLFD